MKKTYTLITGGTGGIGVELAKLFAADGHNLILVARNEDELAATRVELSSKPTDVITIAKDLFNPEAPFELYEETRRLGLNVDILVNNAGQGLYGLFAESDIRSQLSIVQLNCSSLISLTHLYIQDMLHEVEGKILNLSSIASKSPGPWQAVYHATKAFVQSFTEALRSEVKENNITVTALLPGVTDTDFFNKAGMNDSKAVQDQEKMADPVNVAKDGYKALMKGDDMVVSGFKNKTAVAISNILPDHTNADMVKKQQEPVTIKNRFMKAAVIHAPGKISCDTVDDPILKDDRDIILKITATAICGSDLHIYSGGIPQPRPMVLGHEFMGIVEETGIAVKNLKKGDRVIVPFPIACGHCFFCNHDVPGNCEHSNPEHYGPEGGLLSQKGGALFGYTDLYGGYDGGQAQYVRVPYADYGPRLVPDNLTDEQVLFLTDIFPTGYTGIDWGELKGGETVAIFGSGPVGIMAAKAAWLKGAGRVLIIDTLQYRLDMAATAADCETILWEGDGKNVIEQIRSVSDNRGADLCVDAVGFEPDRNLLDRAKAVVNLEKGSPKVLEACMSAVRRSGIVSVLGVYPTTYDNFPVGQFFDKGITLKGGQAPAHKHIDKLLQYVKEGKVVLDDIITHRLPLTKIADGYCMFKKKEDNCVKVVLDPWAE